MARASRRTRPAPQSAKHDRPRAPTRRYARPPETRRLHSLKKSRRGAFFRHQRPDARTSLAPAHDGHVVRRPLAIGHAHIALRGAFRFRRAPETNLLEILDAVGLAAFGAEQRVV